MVRITVRHVVGFVGVVAVLGGIAAGCGPAVCDGDSCNCPSGETCDFGTKGTARFNCESGSTCTGSGGAASSVVCAGKSCTVSVGIGSSVTCSSGTCNVTCNGTCTIACAGGTCNTTCGGGTAPSATGCN